MLPQGQVLKLVNTDDNSYFSSLGFGMVVDMIIRFWGEIKRYALLFFIE